MNKKTIIQLAIVVVAFALSGMVLYFGYFKGRSTDLPALQGSPLDTAAVGPNASEEILPNGPSFNADAVFKKQKLNYGLVSYPKLNAANEVGIATEELVKPLVSPKPAP